MTKRIEERFADLCAAAALGALDGDERRELEQLLRQADERMLVIPRELDAAVLHLAAPALPVEPPAGAKDRLMEAVRSGGIAQTAAATRDTAESSEETTRPDQMTHPDLAMRLARLLGLDNPRLALAIAAGLALLIAGLAIATATLQHTAGRSEVRIAELTDELRQREEILEVLQSKSIEVVVLNGLDLNPGGYGKILWDTENRVAVLQVANLPPPPGDSTYQLWVFPREGDPQSAGVIALSEPGRPALFRIENMPRIATAAIKGWLITMEPAGGAARPSEAWYLGARTPT